VIHNDDPFATPEPARSQVRRLRGRFAQTVTLWTAPGPAGLTVSSCLVADGEPGRLLGLIDDESEVWSAISAAGTFVVSLLSPEDRQLADRFAGLMPAPGGLFRQGDSWMETAFGPALDRHPWAGCRLESARIVGWGLLVEATIEEIHLTDQSTSLLHHRGTYGRVIDR
jgi:3-hydroxy-9,10-secoandrosta-1,3,5(10)-triene-9,17-dione monooxygenase reductase component